MRPPLRSILIIVVLLLGGPGAPPPRARAHAPTQEPPSRPAAAEAPRGRVLLNLAAHPDDEDGPLLAYYARRHGVRTAIVAATRGEGGQNAIGEEMGEALGAIRTSEMAAAATALGAEVRFLGLPDFGYSKSAEESLRVWDQAVALERLVRRIREIGPDVIVTNHDPNRGHGHHRALAVLAALAFEAAADPRAFPDHAGAGLPPHRTRRLYFRTGGPFGETDPEESFPVPVGETDPESGRSYLDIAGEALRLHRSQGPWSRLPPGWAEPEPRYRLVKSTDPIPPKPQPGLFADIPERPLWARDFWETEPPGDLLARGGAELVAEAAARLGAAAEEGGLEPTRARWARRRADLLERVVWGQLQILGDGSVKPPAVAPGGSATVRLLLQNAGRHEVEILSIRIAADDVVREIGAGTSPDGRPGEVERKTPDDVGDTLERIDARKAALPPGARISTVARLDLPPDFPPTVPLPGTLGLRDGVAPLVDVRVRYRFAGFELVHRLHRALEVRPDFSLRVEPGADLVPAVEGGVPATASEVRVHVTNRTARTAEGSLSIADGRGVESASLKVSLPPGESVHAVRYPVRRLRAEARRRLSARLRLDGAVHVTAFEAHVAHLRFDATARFLVLEGVDHSVSGFLRELGVESLATEWPGATETPEAPGGLSRYDTIVIGPRAGATGVDLASLEAPLREYVRGGGHLVVLYHKSFEVAEGRAPAAPYPLPISRRRVTREDAAVEVLEPGHPLLNSPNVIGGEEWTDWVQERGLYFPEGYDERYVEILSMADPDEEPLTGGLLYAADGEGSYVYTSLVWHRQLRAAHPGAARLLANILTAPARRP